jgi:hypothetical protein
MNAFTVSKHDHSRFWAVRDSAGELVCVCVYKRGAAEVVRRLTEAGNTDCLRETPATEFPAIPVDMFPPPPERGSVR